MSVLTCDAWAAICTLYLGPKNIEGGPDIEISIPAFYIWENREFDHLLITVEIRIQIQTVIFQSLYYPSVSGPFSYGRHCEEVSIQVC